MQFDRLSALGSVKFDLSLPADHDERAQALEVLPVLQVLHLHDVDGLGDHRVAAGEKGTRSGAEDVRVLHL